MQPSVSLIVDTGLVFLLPILLSLFIVFVIPQSTCEWFGFAILVGHPGAVTLVGALRVPLPNGFGSLGFVLLPANGHFSQSGSYS